MNKEQQANCTLYSMYTILYLNDATCNNILALSKYVKNRDKETRKIFGALEKRSFDYFYKLRKIIGLDKMYFFSDFCSEMDGVVDPLIEKYEESIKKTYEKHGLTDCEFYAKVETIRSLSDLSIIAGKRILERLLEVSDKSKNLNQYLLTEINRITQNFATWVYRKEKKGIDLNKEEDVLNNLNKLYQEVIDYKNFEKSYKEALKYEKQK